ncbi:MAG: hypothetical protein HZA17_02445 [Nitrospirae bacterium]|nr:hypothetical protein [Nitrospirota bacterium]
MKTPIPIRDRVAMNISGRLRCLYPVYSAPGACVNVEMIRLVETLWAEENGCDDQEHRLTLSCKQAAEILARLSDKALSKPLGILTIKHIMDLMDLVVCNSLLRCLELADSDRDSA